jgi:glycine oxidase
MIERGRIGREASWAAAGMLSPQIEALQPGPFFDLCLRSRSIYPALAAELLELAGVDIEYRSEGALCILFDAPGREQVEQWAGWQQDRNLPLDILSSQALRTAEPAVTKEATGAVFVPGDHQIDNRRLMEALETALRRLKVNIVEGVTVDRILLDHGRAAGVAMGDSVTHAGLVIVASGCWSGPLLRSAGLSADIIPVRGQMLALKGATMPISHVLHSEKCYVIPRRDGRVLIGATVERVGFDKATTPEAITSLLEGAIEMVPELRGFDVVETWSGLRPDTADHLPIMGESGVDNLLLATGHFRNGILLAPLSADLLATTVTSDRHSPELSQFNVGRFRALLDTNS